EVIAMSSQFGFSPRYDAALALAARAHRLQLRKGTDLPYIAHPVHVSLILIRHGFGEDLAIAGLLHDVVEDTDVPLDQIAAEFGDQVAELVDAVSETKSADGAERPWEERKVEKLAHLLAGGPDVAALKAADAIHNARSVAADLRQSGPSVWGRFKRGADQTLWYYREILAGVRAKLGDHPIVLELAAAVEDLVEVAGA
ncbi:MAG TPA: HD domain-containing protein, partial [Roseiflexaceae bacterium]|nr:HD domain-containing protein [Roseiflexaceae bacterium]